MLHCGHIMTSLQPLLLLPMNAVSLVADVKDLEYIEGVSDFPACSMYASF